MNKYANTFRIIKKFLYLSGLLVEEPTENYPKNTSKIGVRAERVIVTKNLFLDPYLTITMLAKEIGTNRTYLSKFFREEKDCNFRDYINLLRAEKAKSHICSPEKQSMADIAVMSGFGSVRAMNRSFLKNYGKLPTLLRKEYLLGNSIN